MDEVDELKEKTRDVLLKLERLALDGSVEPEGKSSKPRVRSRKSKQKEPIEPVALSSSTLNPIDHTMQFVLEMCMMPQERWAQHIRDMALRKGIIELDQSSQTTSPKYTWSSGHAQNKHTESLLDLLNNTEQSQKRSTEKKRRFLNLDESINELIPDPKLHISLSAKKVHSEADLDKALTRIAETLVAVGLGTIDEGELHVTKQGMTAFVRTNPEVVIRNTKLRRCALSGDLVRVFIFKDLATTPSDLVQEIACLSVEESEEELEPTAVAEEQKEIVEELSRSTLTGFIICIVKEVHSRSGIVGQFGENNSGKNLTFFPHERGIPRVNIPSQSLKHFAPIDVSLAEYMKGLSKQLFEVELTNCNSFSNVYNGRVVSVMGTKGNVVDENACILLRHGFRKGSHSRMDRLGETYAGKGQLPEEASEAAKRKDLTKMCIFTIDPATARDLDDAMSCRLLENGNYEVGIHISDVTHYVVENSDLDELVREAKTTSVYMVDQVYHMLPSVLCQQCSLLPSEEKRAVSVFVEMTSEAEVVSTSYSRTLINSCCQLSYEQAQKIIDDEDPLTVAPLTIYNGFSASDLRSTIKSLHKLSRIMRDRRMRNGALKFDKPKYYFRLNEANQPVELLSEMSKPANHLIEEFMILANQLVGEYIYRTYPGVAILRQHNPPKMDEMSKVKAFFRDQGFPELNYRSAKEINASMDAILAECDRRQLDRQGFELILNCLLAKPMNRAQYFCTGDDRYTDQFTHFALAIPFYTHFTSPIRRYPDIMVHRLLIRAMGGQPAPKTWQMSEVISLMGVCNRQKMNSRYASEDSSRLFFIHYLRNQFPGGRLMKATVSNVLQSSVEVKLWETGDEFNISLQDLKADVGVSVEKREGGLLIKKTNEAGEVVSEMDLRIFTTCMVRVFVVRDHVRASLDV